MKIEEKLPLSFRPILWSFKWDALDVWENRADIIINTVNEGTLEQWRWLVSTYGKEEIAHVLEKRLESEFHPESRRLAQLFFPITQFRYAR